MSDKLYKVLGPDGCSIHGGDLKWSFPTKRGRGHTPEKWHSVTGDVACCDNGLHLTTKPLAWYKRDCQVFEAEGEGSSDTRGDKTAFQRARLLRPSPHPQWWEDLMGFTEEIKGTPFFRPDGRPLKSWKLFEAESRAAARAAAGDAARDAAL